MGVRAGWLAGDKARAGVALLCLGASDESVERSCDLECDPWPVSTDPKKECAALPSAFVVETAHIDANARPTQMKDAASADQRILVAAPDHHAADAGALDGLGARAGATLVAAGFQRDIEGRASGADALARKGFDLGVGQAGAAVIAPRQHAAAAHQQGAHHRVGAGLAAAAFGQGQRLAHEASVGFGEDFAHESWPFQRRSLCTSLSSSVASLKCMYTVAKRR